MNDIKIRGRKLYCGTKVVGEITGWRQMTAKWGATGPGYGFKLINGRECDPCYAYFDETVKAAKYEASKMLDHQTCKQERECTRTSSPLESSAR